MISSRESLITYSEMICGLNALFVLCFDVLLFLLFVIATGSDSDIISESGAVRLSVFLCAAFVIIAFCMLPSFVRYCVLSVLCYTSMWIDPSTISTEPISVI